ncbi:MAG: transketolase [Pseudomonadota bacterium]|nr:transketolase [Pseudomonadota bacterium]
MSTSLKARTTPVAELQAIAAELRGKIISYSHYAKLPHLGSCLSCVDILTALYFSVLRLDPANPRNPARDRFILSKGHAAPALFQVLAMRGFYPEIDMFKPDHGDGLFGEHPPTPEHLAGVEAATGSLGHGFPMGCGMALGGKIKKQHYRVFALLSDGECNEGSIWEAAMFASAKGLTNLTAIVDFNKWQATDRSEEVLALSPLAEKWRAFGWDAVEIDGHDMEALLAHLTPQSRVKPLAIVAHTVKGKGVSFMEDDNNWHYRIPNEQEVAKAKKELGIA